MGKNNISSSSAPLPSKGFDVATAKLPTLYHSASPATLQYSVPYIKYWSNLLCTDTRFAMQGWKSGVKRVQDFNT